MSSMSGLRAAKVVASAIMIVALASTSSASTFGEMSMERRAVQSEAVCLDEFSWMDNSLKQSPCIVAGYLLSACAGGNWNIAVVDANHHYTPPNATTANGCSCSWAVYNTMQACADCQGENFQSAMLTWAAYNPGCNGTLLSDTEYYPAGTPIPDETAIPFWATQDPTTWQDGEFNPSTAESIANENKADITESTRNNSNSGGKKTNAGAIAGGVVGGVLFLLILGLIAFFIARRNRNRRLNKSNNGPSHTNVRFSPIINGHLRNGSENTVQHKSMLNYFTTPSPGPTLPVSMNSTGEYYNNGTSRPQYPTMPSSTSFTTATMSPPPGEYPMHTQNKNLGLPPGALGPGMMMMNNPSNQAPSTAYATAHGHGHSHTLSSDGSVFSGNGEPPEGAIVPFVLPPTLPEPMAGIDGTRSPTPSGGKATNGHGQNESNGSNDLFTAAVPSRKPVERRNPPAYTFGISPSSSPAPGGQEEEDGEEDGGNDSVAAQAPETSLSGTTLRQPTSSGTQVGSSVVPEGSQAGQSQGRGRGNAQGLGERDQFGYPIDRKA